jgi:hypothetical protein
MLLALAPSVRSVATSAHTATSQVVELREKEEAEEEEAKAAAKAAEAAALMREANLEGVDTLFDDMTAGDEEWAKLAKVRMGGSAAMHACGACISESQCSQCCGGAYGALCRQDGRCGCRRCRHMHVVHACQNNSVRSVAVAGADAAGRMG